MNFTKWLVQRGFGGEIVSTFETGEEAVDFIRSQGCAGEDLLVCEKTTIGDTVICDLCGADWTHDQTSGGIVFGSKACCPACAVGVESKARACGEMGHIHDRCPFGMSFADWVRGVLRADEPGTIGVIYKPCL